MRCVYCLDERIDDIAIKTGGEKYAHEVQRYLEDRHEIKYIYPKSNSFLKGVKYNFRLNAIRAALMLNIFGIKQAGKIDRGSLVITNSYYRHSFTFFPLLIRFFRKGCKTITFVNAIYYYSRTNIFLNLLDKALMFIFLSAADLIIANSRTTKLELENLGINPKKIRVIYPRLDLPGEIVIKPESRGKERIDILFVGYCEPTKEIHVLVEAVGMLQSPVMLHIVGDYKDHPAYTERLIWIMKRYGIMDKVKFHGRFERQDLVNMYAMADIFVSPGSGEGYGRVLIEAMHYGLPVIGANRCASKELIDDGVNGFLFAPGDSHDLQKKIDLLCRDEELRQSMGNEGKRKAATANFTENIGEQFYNVLKAEGLID
jgi:glycosyltransferase involved in cell wall biosynthesis